MERLQLAKKFKAMLLKLYIQDNICMAFLHVYTTYDN